MPSSWNRQYADLMKLSTDSLYESYDEIVAENKRLTSENIVLKDKVQNLDASRVEFLKNAKECMQELAMCKGKEKKLEEYLEKMGRTLTLISKEKAALRKSYAELHGIPLKLVRKDMS
jgi:inactivated superfamily I helicase